MKIESNALCGIVMILLVWSFAKKTTPEFGTGTLTNATGNSLSVKGFDEPKELDLAIVETEDGKKLVELTTISDGIRCRIRVAEDLFRENGFSQSELLQFSEGVIKRMLDSGVDDTKHCQEIVLGLAKSSEIHFSSRYLVLNLHARFVNNCFSYPLVPELWKKVDSDWKCIRPWDGWARIF